MHRMLFEFLISQFNCNHVFKTQFQLTWHIMCTFHRYWYIIINTHNEIPNFPLYIYIYIYEIPTYILGLWTDYFSFSFSFSFFRLYVGPKWYAFLFLDLVYDQSDCFYFLRILYIGPKPYNIIALRFGTYSACSSLTFPSILRAFTSWDAKCIHTHIQL